MLRIARDNALFRAPGPPLPTVSSMELMDQRDVDSTDRYDRRALQALLTTLRRTLLRSAIDRHAP